MAEREEKKDLFDSAPTAPNECSFEAPSVDLVAADGSMNCLLRQPDSKLHSWTPETLQNWTAVFVPVALYCLWFRTDVCRRFIRCVGFLRLVPVSQVGGYLVWGLLVALQSGMWSSVVR